MPPRSLPPPAKKQKRKHTEAQDEVERLEALLTTAAQSTPTGSLNPLADLLTLAESSSAPQDLSRAVYALYRVWVILINGGKMSPSADEGEEAKVVRGWLWDRMSAYQDILVGLLADSEGALRTSALQILFSLQKHISSVLSSTVSPQFHIAHFRKIVGGLIACPPSVRHGEGHTSHGSLQPDILDTFVKSYLDHDDVRWFFLRECINYLTSPHAPANLLAILERIRTFPASPSDICKWWVPELGAKPPKSKKPSAAGSEDDSEDEEPKDGEDDWRTFFDEPKQDATKTKGKGAARLHKMTLHQSLHSVPSHRAVFTRAWLALLPHLSLSSSEDSQQDVRRKEQEKLAIRTLTTLHSTVLPHLTRPILVMDWVGGCVDVGGAVGLLALNALFVLMTQYNLDYPKFYTRLYAFLDRAVLHSLYRARFFRLAELFLGSTHLPVTLLASFLKRLARLSLSAPPAAIVILVPFTYNVMKRHPALMVMIHRVPDEEDAEAQMETDPFNAAESDPLHTQALSSSLWELHVHRSHYHAPVSTMARVLEEAFSRQDYAMEDFLDHGYGSMMDTETKRKIKREPALAMHMRADIFACAAETEGAEGSERDVISELWTF